MTEDTLNPEVLRADMVAGTPGPWTWKSDNDEWPSHSLIGGEGPPILERDMELGFRFHISVDDRRIARLPELEQGYLDMRARAEAAEAMLVRVEAGLDAQIEAHAKDRAEIVRLREALQQASSRAQRTPDQEPCKTLIKNVRAALNTEAGQ